MWRRETDYAGTAGVDGAGYDGAGMAAGHSVDEYLETIYFLAFPIGEYHPQDTDLPTLSSRVAEMLGVSRASAGEMLKRLEADGLVERGARKEAILTASGRERAERAVRKHRIIERLLTDFMGYTAAEAHVHADELGDTFSEDMVERIEARLGHPDRCPHGWPIDTALEQAENHELEPLSALEPGARATIVRLAEHDGDLLHWFYDEGLVPGASVELTNATRAAGQLRVRLDGSDKSISEKAAAGLFVRASRH
jgi:Mn-dependent DtxR family transcriptional regulator